MVRARIPLRQRRAGYIWLMAYVPQLTACAMCSICICALDDPTKVIAQPGGYFLVPEGDEYLGDVMNVAFANGWIADGDGKVFIYYASADTRMHVATSTIDRLIDYCMNTPEDGLTTAASVETIKRLVAKNRANKS